MSDFYSRHMIEALRSGISSRSIGKCFSSSRKALISSLSDSLEYTISNKESSGRIITGRYGEGKTHLLNTVFSMASERNMAVSIISLSKEAPASNMLTLYRNLGENTYLPTHIRPGFMFDVPNYFSLKSESTAQLLSFASGLSTDRIGYVFKAFLASLDNNIDDNYMMRGDIEGNIASNVSLRQIYAKNFNDKMKLEKPFSKYKNAFDYMAFTSKLLSLMGCTGWVILIDEAELIGRMPRKSRKKAYLNLYQLLSGDEKLTSVYSLAVFSTSYIEDVITERAEYECIAKGSDSDDDKTKMLLVLDMISKAEELLPLTDEEMKQTIDGIIKLHAKAYDWNPQAKEEDLFKVIDRSGNLLRTRIRSTIEYLDQLYLYGDAEMSKVGSIDIDDLRLSDIFKDEEDEGQLQG